MNTCTSVELKGHSGASLDKILFSVGASCYYTEKEQKCAYCKCVVPESALIFTHVYDTDNDMVAFDGYFDCNCFFLLFRLKSYLRLDGFHELLMTDRILIEDKIFESKQKLISSWSKQLATLSTIKQQIALLPFEDIKKLVLFNLAGHLSPSAIEDKTNLVKMAVDMVCFGSILDLCPGCKGQLIAQQTKYVCTSDLVKYKTLNVRRGFLKVPKDLLSDDILMKLVANGFGVPRKRILVERN